MAGRQWIASIATFVALATAPQAVAGMAETPPTGGFGPSFPTAEGIDYHRLDMRMRWHKIAELPLSNCTNEFGVGSGECGSVTSDSTWSDPSLGGEKWHIAWDQCNGAPIGIPECHPGWLAIQVWAGNAWFHAYMTGRNSGDLWYVRGSIPAWDAKSEITGPTSGPYASAGQPWGPLHIDVESRGHAAQYDIDINGYLIWKRILRTYDLNGYIQYGTPTEPHANRPFKASLEVLDTPSAPKCNTGNLSGIGGCYGTFSEDGNAPFRGSGGQAGLHWRPSGDGRTLVELVSPSGSRLSGELDGSPNRFKVNSGNVPEWNVDSLITTGTHTGRVGEVGGPIRLDWRGVGAQPRPPRTLITGMRTSSERRTAKFQFIVRGRYEAKGFRCRLDSRPFRPCESPKLYINLERGRHTFEVKAKGGPGVSDRSPARERFTI